jgi:CheY-like chemotaxis protein
MATQVLPDAGIAETGHLLTVLLVEDNDGDAALLEASLTGACTGSPLHPFVELIRVRTLAAGLERLASSHPQVILLDLGLPDSSGLDTLRSMRAKTDLAIVVLTGLADEQVALDAMQGGAQDYLFKGEVAPGTTLRAMRYAIERSRLQAELTETRYLAGIGQTVLAVLHELNNPLTSLLIDAELLASGPPDPELARSVVESAKRIALVTKRLAQQSRPRTVEYVKGMPMLDLG